MPKFPITQFVVAYPFATAAAIAAPFFIKNEDRGYFRTALITTPIILAAGELVPTMFGSKSDIGRTARDIGNIFRTSKKTTNVVDKMTADFLISGRVLNKEAIAAQNAAEFGSLSRQLNRKYVIRPKLFAESAKKRARGDMRATNLVQEILERQEDKRYQLTKAFHSARASSLTMQELADEVPASATAMMTNEQMIAMFDQYAPTRPKFVRALSNKLRSVAENTYRGTTTMIDTPFTGNLLEFPVSFEGEGNTARAAFQRISPEVFDQYAQLAKNRRIHALSIYVDANDVVDGTIGRVLNVKVSRWEQGNLSAKRRLEEIAYSIEDPTGTIRMPGNRAIGVGRSIMGPDFKARNVHSWLPEMMMTHEEIPFQERYAGGPSLQGDIDVAQYYHSGDITEGMTEAETPMEFSEGARRRRAMGANFSTLPVFKDEAGALTAYGDLSPSRQQFYTKEVVNRNEYTILGNTTNEGHFVRREAGLLSPYGAFNPEKGEYMWTSMTKEMELRFQGNLPADARLGWRSTAWGGDLPAAKSMIASIDPVTRTRLVNELRASGQTELSDAFGRMGETGAIMKRSFAENFSVEGVSKYNVTEHGVKVGDHVYPNNIIGYNANEEVVAKLPGEVIGVTGDIISIQHQLDPHGGKFHIAGVKGMIPLTPEDEMFEAMRAAHNKLAAKTGKDLIPANVNMLMPAEYFADKVEPAAAYLGMGGELANRLESVGAGALTSEYRVRMESELATSLQAGQLVIDAGKLNIGTDEGSAQAIIRLADITEALFEKSSIAIRKASGYADPVLKIFANSSEANIGNWMLRNQFPGMMAMWDHSLVNAPRFAPVTWDMSTHMLLGGNRAGLAAIRSRAVTTSTGDARQAFDFMNNLMGGKYDQGTAVPIGEAFRNNRNLHTAAGRQGSIFDPSVEAYRDNFRVDLGGGQFLPVPGTNAYMAEANAYAPGEYATQPWHHTLQKIAYESNAERKTALVAQYKEELQEGFGIGKGNVLRPYSQDPMSVSGAFSVMAEEENPFAVRISREMVEKVRSKSLRDALLAGEKVMGMPIRQPINQTMYGEVVMDEAMNGTRDVSLSERFLRALFGDQDKDPAYLHLFDARIDQETGKAIMGKGTLESEAAAAEEAFAAMHGGRQEEFLKAWESVKGTPEVANTITEYTPKNLRSRLSKFAQGVRQRTDKVISRMAGGATGSYSNALSEIDLHMASNPAIRDNTQLAGRLNALMFDIRQAPIAANKSATFSLVEATTHINRLKRAIENPNPVSAAEDMHASIMNLSHTLNPEKFSTSKEFEYLTKGTALEDLTVMTRGRIPEATMMKEALTAVADRSKPFSDQYQSRNLSRVWENIESSISRVFGGGRASGANESASRLGAIAETIATAGRTRVENATGQMGKVFQRHGKGIAMGLGALALLGVALAPNRAPVASFSRSSGNRFRPEERMGVSDNVPGDPVPGQMAPSNPPRRIIAAQQGVRTAVVAPMGHTSDVSVRMRATDQSRAAETARLMSQIPGTGDTNVTINYRDRTRLRSLRTREKIREMR